MGASYAVGPLRDCGSSVLFMSFNYYGNPPSLLPPPADNETDSPEKPALGKCSLTIEFRFGPNLASAAYFSQPVTRLG